MNPTFATTSIFHQRIPRGTPARTAIGLLLLTLLFLLTAVLAPAATITWSGLDLEADDNWTTADNWEGGLAPSPGDNLVFGNSKQANDNDFPTNTPFAAITFTNGNWVLNGNPLILTNAGVVVFWDQTSAPSYSNTFNMPITFVNNAIISNLAPARALVFNGALSNGGNLITVGTVGGGMVILRGPIVGAGGLTKTGGGTLVLTNSANSYSNNTTVSAGTLKLGAANVIPDGGGRGDVIVNGTLDLNGKGDTINGLTGTGLITNSSSTAVSLTVCNRGVSTTYIYDGFIKGNINLHKAQSSPILVLTRQNTYMGGTTNKNGTLRMGTNNALPPTTFLTLGVSGNANTLDLAGFNQQVGGLLQGTVNMNAKIANSSTNADSTLTFSNSVNASTFAGTIVDAVSGGTRKVNVSVAGGTLTLAGTNSYSGVTTVTNSESKLVVTTKQTGGGAFTVFDGAHLAVTVASSNASLNVSSLSLGASGAHDGTLTLNFGSLGNPTNAPITATSLSATGTVAINITGTGLQLGQFPLIKYSGTIGGSGFGAFVKGSLPAGLAADLVNNTGNSSIDLDVKAFAGSVVWRGETNGVPVSAWDIGATTNWTDPATGQPDAYNENIHIGDVVLFDDSASNANVTVTTAVKPGMVTVSNDAIRYTIGGPAQIVGEGWLVKQGTATLALTSANSFSGGSTLTEGLLQIGHNSALGSGRVTLNGASLASDSTSGRTLANNIVVVATSALGDTNPAGNGSLTFSGDLDLNNGARNLTVHSPVTWMGHSGNGRFHKLGAGTLTLRSTNNWNGDAEIRDGALVLRGGAFTNSGVLRVDAQDSEGNLARLAITDGAILVLTGTGANLRCGYDVASGAATNTLDIAGTVRMSYATTANGRLILGRQCSLGQANLLSGGDLEVRQIRSSDNASATVGISEFNFDGGVLRAQENNSSFVAGLTNAFVRGGGAIIDTAGFDVTIPQLLRDGGGSGGLSKNGLGTLTLTAANTYTGPASVSSGKLGITTAHAGGGGFTVSDGATLAVTLPVPSQTLNMSGLTLGSATGATNEFHLNGFGNPVVPVVFATNLVTHGTVTLQVSGGGFELGHFSLIQYAGVIGGSGYSFVLAPLPPGVGAFLSNAPTAVELVITNVTPLIWTGNTDTNWDIGTTVNWRFNGVPTSYQDGGTALFDDTATTTNVWLLTSVEPGCVSVSNLARSYTIGGPGRLGGAARLVKEGAGTLNLNTTNTYTGNTLLNGGALKLGAYSSISNSLNITVASNALLDVSALTAGLSIGNGHSLHGAGTITGSVTVAMGASLAPDELADTLTFRDGLMLQGTATMKIKKTGASLTNNKIVVNNLLTYGGTSALTVLAEGDALAGGDAFDLFDAASFDGAFYSCNLPALGPGLNWCLNDLTIDGTLSVNRAPVAGNLAVQTLPAIPLHIGLTNLLSLCSDPDSHSLTVTAVGSAAHGSASLNPELTTLMYHPDAGYSGSDQFSYTISDGHGGGNTGLVTINISTPTNATYNCLVLPICTNGDPKMCYGGFPDFEYLIQRSTNLVDWVDLLTTVMPSGGLLEFEDPTLPDPLPESIFYRAFFAVGAAVAQSAEILQATGIKGGFVVHVGCGNGRLTAGLRPSGSYMVHGLDRDADDIATARDHIRSRGLYGPVSVEQWSGARLPYVDGFVNLVVLEDMGTITMDEVLRVLAPLGVAYVKQGDTWAKTIKPRPAEIDDWTHYLYDATGICTSHDSLAGPPNRFRWIGGPRFSRHHDVMSSFNACVSANGRLFYVIDEGSRASILQPPSWSLVARDAFSGAILWKRSLSSWHPSLYGFKSGPTQLTRRLVAVGDKVYIPLDYYGPASELDAATGEILQTFAATQTTEEIIWSQGTLFLVTCTDPKIWVLYDEWYKNGVSQNTAYTWNDRPRTIMAVNPANGAVLWQLTSDVFPTSLSADASGVVFHNGDRIIKLDRADGHQLWQSSDPAPVMDPYYTAFGASMIMYQDTVIMAGGKNKNVVSVDSATGQILAQWTHGNNTHVHCPHDLFIVDDLVWSTAAADKNPICTGYDRRSGAVMRTIDPGLNMDYIHQRCYRSKATTNYFMTSRTGIEFMQSNPNGQPASQRIGHDWVRGACLYGIIPANGMVYSTPNNCACLFETKLSGLCAMYSNTNYPAADSDADRLQQGPAYGQPVPNNAAAGDWPMYRHDQVRSGYTTNEVTAPAALQTHWENSLGGKLSSVTVAEGRLFVATVDTHTVWALDAETGVVRWSYTTGGRVDSPPTIHEGRVLFGSADGWVYCLRATDGALIWRFLAAPTDLRLASYEQLESVWPVSGSVLIQNGRVCCVSGRSMFMDGGLRLLFLDLATGTKLDEKILDDKDPATGNDLWTLHKQFNGPVALADLLSSDGQYLYMKSQQFDLNGVRQRIAPFSSNNAANVTWTNQIGEGVHLFAPPTGFLDETWVHRGYWVWGKSFSSGAGGYYLAGKQAPCGQILVVDDANVYGFGRKLQYYVWTRPKENMLFSTPSTNAFNLANPFNWTNTLPLLVRAMVATKDNLFVAGPPDLVDEAASINENADASVNPINAPQTQANLAGQDAAWAGVHGGQLRVVAKATGATVAMYSLNFLPAWDGMAASRGSLYLSTLDGRVICLR